jgi:hypothetical protein
MLLDFRTVTAVSESVLTFHCTLKTEQFPASTAETDKNCVILVYHSASRGNFLPPFRDDLSVEDGTDRLYRNVGKKLPLLSSGVQHGIYFMLEKTENC